MRKLVLALIAGLALIVGSCGARTAYEILEQSENPTPEWAKITNDVVEIATENGEDLVRLRVIAEGKSMEEANSADFSAATRESLSKTIAGYLNSRLEITEGSPATRAINEVGEAVGGVIKPGMANVAKRYWEKIRDRKTQEIFYRVITEYNVSTKIVMQNAVKEMKKKLKEFSGELKQVLKTSTEQLEDWIKGN